MQTWSRDSGVRQPYAEIGWSTSRRAAQGNGTPERVPDATVSRLSGRFHPSMADLRWEPLQRTRAFLSPDPRMFAVRSSCLIAAAAFVLVDACHDTTPH